jgi:hypothetical protein
MKILDVVVLGVMSDYVGKLFRAIHPPLSQNMPRSTKVLFYQCAKSTQESLFARSIIENTPESIKIRKKNYGNLSFCLSYSIVRSSLHMYPTDEHLVVTAYIMILCGS